MARYSIRDLEILSGIKAHTLRVWEKRYGIIEPKRTDTNIRYYDDDDLKKVLNIAILNNSGLKISKIASLPDDQIQKQVVIITEDSKDEVNQLDSLVLSMIDLDEAKFEKNLSNSIIKLGFEETVTRVIYPFLEKIGILWQVGSINPAQEHFISNLVRQKIIVAIDKLEPNCEEDCKKALLFLKEDELHELGLLFYQYLLKKNGVKVIYLGQSVPMEDLETISKIKDPDLIVSSFISSLSHTDFKKYIQQLAEKFPGKKIYIGGNQVSTIKFKLPANVIPVPDINVFKKEVL